jgi:DNA-binding NarL/FixJ family response regulator
MTPAEEVGKCSECGSIDKGTRYLITPPTEGNPLGTFCKNAWHHVPPEVHQDEFTEQEFQFIFGICWGLPLVEIAEQCKIDHSIVMNAVSGIYRKVGVSTRLEFVHHFVRAALNAELRGRKG